MSQIVFLKFNNYFNKELKVYETYQEYLSYVVDDISIDYRSFNINDGVDTQIVVNTLNDHPTADYCLALDENYNMSRWFILDYIKIRGKQFRAVLKRDVLADNFNEVKTAPLYIKRAMLDNGDPYIFNQEDVSFNKIKQKEILLKDSSNSAWIVGYIAPDALVSNDLKVEIPTEQYVSWDEDYNYLLSRTICRKEDVSFNTWYTWYSAYHEVSYQYTMKSTINANARTSGPQSGNPSLVYLESRVPKMYSDTNLELYSNTYEYLRDSSKVNQMLEWARNGQLFNYNNSYYQVRAYLEDGETIDTDVSGYDVTTKLAENGTLFNSMNSMLESKNISRSAGANTFSVVARCYKFILVPASQDTLTYKLNASATKVVSSTTYLSFDQLFDAPYALFYMEYNEDNRKLMSALATQLGDNLYDLQLLPYKPLNESKVYWWLQNDEDPTEPARYIYFALQSKFEVEIPTQIVPNESYKVDFVCNMYRIVSPNFANNYEFSPAMNNGVELFHANCTYKPYQPVIDVHPNYKGLYGNDYDDNRGLTLGGDFSLPILTDQWIQYQINNKNYENSFNRQQQYQIKMNKISRVEQAVSSGASALGTGMSAGLYSGSGVFGAISGGLSAIAGGVDYGLTKYSQNQALKLNRELFNMNNENMQARPQSLSKTDAFNINNKVFPFVEFYTCTDEELEAFKNYIEYNGMSVDRIGTLGQFASGYFEAQPIKLFIDNDTHVSREISEVLSRGIYIKEVY